MTLSIEASAVAVLREACITYSCGFQKLSRKNMFEGRLAFVFPSPNAFHLLRHPLCLSFLQKQKFLAFLVVYRKKKKLKINKKASVVLAFFFVCRVFHCSILNG